jgi:sec-independent protein translocase protein TatA
MPTSIIAGVGPLELLLVLLIVLVIFGGRRLPALGRQLGDGMRGFKDSVTRRTESDLGDDEAGRPQATAALGRSTGDETPVDGEVMRERR